jgi:protein TonB
MGRAPERMALPEAAAEAAPPKAEPPPEPTAAPARAAETPAPDAPPDRTAASASAAASAAAPAAAAPAPALDKGARASLISDWGARVVQRIDKAKRYPRGAEGEGKVTLELVLAPSGHVVSARIARSSGNPALDEAALGAVARAGRMPKAPKGLDEQSYRFALAVAFRR